jgi:hypothetical protein
MKAIRLWFSPLVPAAAGSMPLSIGECKRPISNMEFRQQRLRKAMILHILGPCTHFNDWFPRCFFFC